jgi:hypothetical protein
VSAPWRARALLGALVLALVPGGTPVSGDPPRAQSHEIRGVVVDKQGNGLTWVMIWVRDSRRVHVGSALSDEGGRFVVSGLPAGRLSVDAKLFGTADVLPGYDLTTEVSAGTTDLTLVMERGLELFLKSEGGPFVAEVRADYGTKLSPAMLVLQGPKGPLTYSAGIDAGRAVFRRIKPGLPWTLWIPWRSTMNGTLYETGSRLESGERSVALEPGKRVSVRTTPRPEGHDPGGSISWARVFVTRGPMELAGEWGRDGTVSFPPLATGRWTFTARSWEPQSRHLLEATAEGEAGGPPLLLNPEPLKR